MMPFSLPIMSEYALNYYQKCLYRNCPPYDMKTQLPVTFGTLGVLVDILDRRVGDVFDYGPKKRDRGVHQYAIAHRVLHHLGQRQKQLHCLCSCVIEYVARSRKPRQSG